MKGQGLLTQFKALQLACFGAGQCLTKNHTPRIFKGGNGLLHKLLNFFFQCG
jgi:hypothetical protein